MIEKMVIAHYNDIYELWFCLYATGQWKILRMLTFSWINNSFLVRTQPHINCPVKVISWVFLNVLCNLRKNYNMKLLKISLLNVCKQKRITN